MSLHNLRAKMLVIPATAGIHHLNCKFNPQAQVMDPRLRGGDAGLYIGALQ